MGDGSAGFFGFLFNLAVGVAAFGSVAALLVGLIRVLMRRWTPLLNWSPAITVAPVAIVVAPSACPYYKTCLQLAEPIGGMGWIADLHPVANLVMPVAAIAAIWMAFRGKGGAGPWLRPLSLLIGLLAAYLALAPWLS